MRTCEDVRGRGGLSGYKSRQPHCFPISLHSSRHTSNTQQVAPTPVSQWVSEWVSHSKFQIGDCYRISELCELVFSLKQHQSFTEKSLIVNNWTFVQYFSWALKTVQCFPTFTELMTFLWFQNLLQILWDFQFTEWPIKRWSDDNYFGGAGNELNQMNVRCIKGILRQKK